MIFFEYITRYVTIKFSGFVSAMFSVGEIPHRPSDPSSADLKSTEHIN